jgi:hypothetical protein
MPKEKKPELSANNDNFSATPSLVSGCIQPVVHFSADLECNAGRFIPLYFLRGDFE